MSYSTKRFTKCSRVSALVLAALASLALNVEASILQKSVIDYATYVDNFHDLNVDIPLGVPDGAGGQSLDLSINYNSYNRDYTFGQSNLVAAEDAERMKLIGHWTLGGLAYIRPCERIKTYQSNVTMASPWCFWNGQEETVLVPVMKDASDQPIQNNDWDFFRIGALGGEEDLSIAVLGKKDGNGGYTRFELRNARKQNVTVYENKHKQTEGTAEVEYQFGSANEAGSNQLGATFFPTRIKDLSGYGRDIVFSYFTSNENNIQVTVPKSIIYSRDETGTARVHIDFQYGSITTEGPDPSNTRTRYPFLEKVLIKTQEDHETAPSTKYRYELDYAKETTSKYGSAWLQAVRLCPKSTLTNCRELQLAYSPDSGMAVGQSGRGALRYITQPRREANSTNWYKSILTYNIEFEAAGTPEVSDAVSIDIDGIKTRHTLTNSVPDKRLDDTNYLARDFIVLKEVEEKVGTGTSVVISKGYVSSENLPTFGLISASNSYRGSGGYDSTTSRSLTNHFFNYDEFGRLEKEVLEQWEYNAGTSRDVKLWTETTHKYYTGYDYTSKLEANQSADDCTNTADLTRRVGGETFKGNAVCQVVESVENENAEADGNKYLNEVSRFSYYQNASEPVDPSTGYPSPNYRNAIKESDSWACLDMYRGSSCTVLGGSMPSGRTTTAYTYSTDESNNLYPSVFHTVQTSGVMNESAGRKDLLQTTFSYDQRGNVILEKKDNLTVTAVQPRYAGKSFKPNLIGIETAWSGAENAANATQRTDYGSYSIAFGNYDSVSVPVDSDGNSITTVHEFDDLGSLKKITRNTDYVKEFFVIGGALTMDSRCPSGTSDKYKDAAYYVKQTETGSPTTVSCYNVRDQILRKITEYESISGTSEQALDIYQDYQYLTNSAALEKQSVPYEGTGGNGYAEPNGATTYTYENGRLAQVRQSRRGVSEDLVQELDYGVEAVNSSVHGGLYRRMLSVKSGEGAGTNVTFDRRQEALTGPQGRAITREFKLDGTSETLNGSVSQKIEVDPNDFIKRVTITSQSDTSNDAGATLADGSIDAYQQFNSFGLKTLTFGDQIGKRWVEYNAFGQPQKEYVSGQTQAKVTSLYRYAVGTGALAAIVDLANGDSAGGRPAIYFQYDSVKDGSNNETCENGWNKLCQLSYGKFKADGSGFDPGSVTSQVAYDYNHEGQICRKTLGVKLKDKELRREHDMFFTYNQAGRINQMLYPNGHFSDKYKESKKCESPEVVRQKEGEFGERLLLEYTYAKTGEVIRIDELQLSEDQSSTNKVKFWQLDSSTSEWFSDLLRTESTFGPDVLKNKVATDSAGRVREISAKYSSSRSYGDLRSQNYSYTSDNNLGSITDRFTGNSDSSNYSFSYDERDRLIFDGFQNFSYGKSGNILSSSSGTTVWEYNYKTLPINGTPVATTALRLENIKQDGNSVTPAELTYDDLLSVNSLSMANRDAYRPNITNIEYNSSRKPTLIQTDDGTSTGESILEYIGNDLVYIEESLKTGSESDPDSLVSSRTSFFDNLFEDSEVINGPARTQSKIRRAYVYGDSLSPLGAVVYESFAGVASQTEGASGSERRRLQSEYFVDGESSDADGIHNIAQNSSGDVYAEFVGDSPDDYMSWQVSIDEPGLYQLTLDYHYEDVSGSGTRTLELFIDGIYQSDVVLNHQGFDIQGGRIFSTWSSETDGSGSFELVEGPHTVSIYSKSETQGGVVWFDHIDLLLDDHKIDQIDFKTAKQSSIDQGTVNLGPHMAINGNTACDMDFATDASLTNTDGTSPYDEHWWQGDVAVQTTITSIRIHVGADCAVHARPWLGDFTVMVSNTDISQLVDLNDNGLFDEAKAVSSIYRSQTVVLDPAETDYDWLAPDGGVEGRYVSIWTTNGMPIQLTEVEVFGHDIKGSGVLRERWSDVYGYRIHNLTNSSTFPAEVSETSILPSLKDEPNQGDNFGRRIRGYLIAPVEGFYDFEIAGSEETEFSMGEGSDWGTGASETNKAVKALVDGTNRISPFILDQQEELSANQKYYIEIFDKEAVGDDELTIKWKKPGDSGFSEIPEQYLEVYAGPVCGAGTDCLLAGSAPLSNQSASGLQSENRQYEVTVDPLNNNRLTLRDSGTGAVLWDSGAATDSTDGENPMLYLAGDGDSETGDLKFIKNGNTSAWVADTAWSPERLELTNDGVLRLLDRRGDVLWQVDQNSVDGCSSACRQPDIRDPSIEFVDNANYEAPLAEAKEKFRKLISAMTDTTCSDSTCGRVTEISTTDLSSQDFVSPNGWTKSGEVLRIDKASVQLSVLFKVNESDPFTPSAYDTNEVCSDNSGFCDLSIKSICYSGLNPTAGEVCETCPDGSTCGASNSDYPYFFMDASNDARGLTTNSGYYVVLFRADDPSANDSYKAIGIEIGSQPFIDVVDDGQPIEEIPFDDSLLNPYGSDSPFGVARKAIDGKGLHLSGDRRVSHPLANAYTVTDNTVLEFDTQIANAGDLIAIGLDNDSTEDSATTFKLAGDGTFGIDNAVPTYKTGKVQTYRIDIGDYLAPGTVVDRLFLMAADADTAGGLSDAVFSNVRIFERRNTKVGPIIYPNGPTPLEVAQGSNYVDPATCEDDIDESCEVIITGDTVDTSSALGTTFTLYYDAEDSMGNQATQITQTVVIVDPATIDPFPATSDDDLWWSTDPNLPASVNQHVLENHEHVVQAGEGLCTSVYLPADSAPITGVQVRLKVDDGTTEQWVAAHWGQDAPLVAGSKYVGSAPNANDAWHRLVLDLVNGLQNSTGQAVAIGAGDVISGSAWTMSRGANITETWWDDCVSGGDDIGPVITFPNGNPHGLQVDEIFTDPGYVCTDNQDGSCTVDTIDASELDTSTEGTYPVYYSATDSDLNTTVSTLMVVVDSTAPVITVYGGDAEVWVPNDYLEPDPAFSCDDGGVDCTADVSVDLSQVDTNTLGTYQVTYSYTDDAGNTATEVRTVTVKHAQRIEAEEAELGGGTDLVEYAALTSTTISPYVTNKAQGYRNWSGMSDVITWTINVDTASTYDLRFALGCSPNADGCFKRDLDVYVNGTFAGLIDVQSSTSGWENFIVEPEFYANDVPLAAGSNTVELRVASSATVDGPNVDYMEIIYDDSSEWTNTHAPEIVLLLANPGDPADGSMQLELDEPFTDPGYICMDDVDGDCHHTVNANTVYTDGVTGNTGTAGTYYVTIDTQDTAPVPNVAAQVSRAVEVVAGLAFGNGAHRDIYGGTGSGNGVWALTGHSKYINGTPTASGSLAQLESSHAVAEGRCGDTCGQEIMAYLEAPVTGEYTFYISGSRGTDLHINLDGDPNGTLVEIAEIPGTNYVGYVSPLDKNSAEWTTFPEQVSTYFDHDGDSITGETISLTAGDVIYVRILHKTGWGGWRHVRAAWEVDAADPAEDIPFEIIPGTYLAPYDRLNQ